MTLASKGVTPDFVLMITAPDVKFPYSTEGIPRITSTDSILSGEIVRKSVPCPLVDCELIKLAPDLAVDKVCKFASLDNGAPFTTTAVPNALLLFEEISRI